MTISPARSASLRDAPPCCGRRIPRFGKSCYALGEVRAQAEISPAADRPLSEADRRRRAPQGSGRVSQLEPNHPSPGACELISRVFPDYGFIKQNRGFDFYRRCREERGINSLLKRFDSPTRECWRNHNCLDKKRNVHRHLHAGTSFRFSTERKSLQTM